MSKDNQDEDLDSRVSQKLLAAELQRLRQCVDEMDTQMRVMDKQLAVVETKAKAWGAVAGLVSAGGIAFIGALVLRALKS